MTLPSGKEIPIDITYHPTGRVEVAVEGRTMTADTFGQGTSTHLCLDGAGVELWLEGAPPDVGVVANGKRFYARVESERARSLSAGKGARGGRGAQSEGLVVSPMPGRVLKVLVGEGDEVAAGVPLVVVEAMKMENELSAARGGTVKKVHVSPGATVERGAPLIEVG